MSLSRQKFSTGDRIVVFQNTERIPCCGFVGKKGVVVGYCSKDALIQFDDGESCTSTKMI